MANRELFRNGRGTAHPADTVNAAGGFAYAFEPRHALAQLAATGCLNDTYYESAEKQLETVLELCETLPAEFVAKTAVYARRRGAMKDMPALLCAFLSRVAPELLEKVFPSVVDSGRMLRTFVQILRSGACGRRSLGTRPKRLIQRWFAERGPDEVFFAATGNNPSFSDIIRLAHPRPDTPEREALYKWLLGYKVAAESLPRRAGNYVAWKESRAAGGTAAGELPDAPFLWLLGCGLTRGEMIELTPRLPWTALRMNLVALARAGVFTDAATAELVAGRLTDREEIARTRVFPYQLFQTALAIHGDKGVPASVRNAVAQALEISLESAPLFAGKKAYVLVDVSGSMGAPVTGHRKGATSATRCIDAAALMATAILHRNPGSVVVPFENHVVPLFIDAENGVFENARKLASVGGGGTNTCAPLRQLNQRKATGDVVIYLSDNQSWMDSRRHQWNQGTKTLAEWEAFRARNPGAKLVCVDFQPYPDSQALDREDILNVGGFSDAVFERITTFVQGGENPEHWLEAIERIEL